MEKNINIKEKESGRVIAGLILVAVGASLLLRNLGYYMPPWLFSWPMILILVGIFVGFKSNFRNNSWFIITGVGVFFLVGRFLPQLGLQPLFWPILIIALGIGFILRPGRSSWTSATTEEQPTKWEDLKGPATKYPATGAILDDGDYLVVKSVFSGVNRNIVSKNFQGGHISSVFGGAEIDFSQADITGPVILKLEIVFGGVKLIIPPHWSIHNKIEGVFHGVDDKRQFSLSSAINPDKTVVLTGSAVFGGIEIASYKSKPDRD